MCKHREVPPPPPDAISQLTSILIILSHPPPCPGKLGLEVDHSFQGDPGPYHPNFGWIEVTFLWWADVSKKLSAKHTLKNCVDWQSSLPLPHLKQNVWTFGENCYGDAGTKSTVTKSPCDLGARLGKMVHEKRAALVKFTYIPVNQ